MDMDLNNLGGMGLAGAGGGITGGTGAAAGVVTPAGVEALDVLTLPPDLTIKGMISITTNPGNPGTPILPKATVNDPQAAANALALINAVPISVNDQKEVFASLSTLTNHAPYIPTSPPVKVTDPQILALAQKLGKDPGEVLHNLQSSLNTSFEYQLSKQPPEVAEKLRFAFNFPEGAKNLSPDLKAQLETLTGKALNTVRQENGLSPDWAGPPIDASEFTQKLSTQYDAKFEQALQKAVDNGTITQDQAAQLKTMHYLPGSVAAAPTVLQQLLKTIEGQVITQLQMQFGFDAGWSPKPDTAFYNNVINGNFSLVFQNAVKSYTGNISDTQKALLAKYYANPNDPSIPDSIKQLAKQLEGQRPLMLKYYENPNDPSIPADVKKAAQALIDASVGAIISKYDLDPNWRPQIKTLNPAGVDPVLINKAVTGLNTIQELVNSATKQIDAMPDGPQKNTYLMFLTIIGNALISLQDAIYAMSASQTDASKKLNALKLSIAMDNLEQQKTAQKEVEKKQGKMADTGPLSQILNWVGKIFLVVMSVGLPIPFLLIAVFYVADSGQAEARKTKSEMTNMFTAINDDLGKAAPAATIPLSIFLSGGNPMLMANLLTEDSQSIQLVAEACGADKTGQMIAALVVSLVIQIAAAIAITILTGGTGTAAEGAAVAGKVADAGAKGAAVAEKAAEVVLSSADDVVNVADKAAKIAKAADEVETIAKFGNMSLKNAKELAEFGQKASQVVMSSLQVYNGIVTLNNQLLLAMIAKIKGESQALSEELEAMIIMLKKLVEKLLALLQGNSDWITSINQFQGQKWTDASNIASEITG